MRIIHSDACIAEGAAHLAAVEPRFAMALDTVGSLPLRRRKDGFAALVDAIVSQQVSVAAADAIYGRLKDANLIGPRKIMWASDEDLRACGLSRQKIRYVRALAEARIEAPKVPVVANVIAEATQDPEAIRKLLVDQVTGAVRWRESVLWMAAEGVTEAWEIGAGKALSGMIKRIDRSVATVAVSSAADAAKAAAALKGE